jgi:outer membrane lipoprotein-sorting protein
MKKLVLLVLGLLMALTLTTGCGGGGEAEPTAMPETETETETETDGDAGAILNSTRLAMLQLDNLQADMTLEFSGETEGTVDMQVFVKGSFLEAGNTERPQFKGVVTESTLPSAPAETVAIQSETSYIYDPRENVVLVTEAGSGVPTAYSDLYTLFLGNQTRAVTLMSPGVTNPTIVAEDVAVGDFQTTEIALNPTDTTSVVMAPGAQGTIWIDQDTSLPVKLEYSEDGFGVTWTINSMSLDELDDSVFQPGEDIPADAEEVAGSGLGELVEVASLDEAASQAGFTPLTPSYLPSDLPTEPSSIGVRESESGNSIVLNYALTSEAEVDEQLSGELEGFNPVQTNSIVIRARQSDTPLPSTLAGNVSEVDIRGQSATLSVVGEGQVTLEWTEDGITYTISGNGYGEDEVLQVAEGLE